MLKKNLKTYKNKFLNHFEWFWVGLGPFEEIRQNHFTFFLDFTS